MFFRNYDVGTGGGNMSSPAKVSSFRLDKYKVTVGRFRAFLNANRGTQADPPETGSGANPYIPGSGWQDAWNASLESDKATTVGKLKSCGSQGFAIPTWQDMPSNEELPINCVTWFEAMAFCSWDGGFLPTDAELDYAETGGSEQRVYPWSTPASSMTIDQQHANYDTSNPDISSIHKVGMSPSGDGKYGQSDLAGGLYEFVLDYRAVNSGDSVCTGGKNTTSDCADLNPEHSNGERLLRGSPFFESQAPAYIRTSHFYEWAAGTRYYAVGFRCARAM